MTLSDPLNGLPVYAETLSAQAYLALMHSAPHLIERARIAAPRLGSKDASIHVTYTRPLYKGAFFP